LVSTEQTCSGSKVSKRVLCVDLDGSLLATDLLYESFLGLIRSRPWDIWRVPLWIGQGRAQLKRRLAERANLDVRSLPLHNDVANFLREQHDLGRRLVLATAAEEHLARAVADHLDLFDEVIASDGKSNLKGRAKLRAIEARFGRRGFDYLGDGWEDLPIWESAGAAIVVQPGTRLLKAVRAFRAPTEVFERTEGIVSPWLQMLRVHQWAKNALLFVPLITSHRLTEWPLIAATFIAFFAFSFAASGVYVLNDLIDMPSDRLHPHKKARALASGRVSIRLGLIACPLALAAAIALSALLPVSFLGLLLLYVVTSTLYTFSLKKKLLIDVFCLAGLYTLRILAGGAATGIPMTPWLVAFSMFIFLSLAFVKRYTELEEASRTNREAAPGRGYRAVDAEMIRSVGPASGYIAVLVVCLYVNDRTSTILYRHPEWLWLLCPIILYWISRIWFLAQRGQLHTDPLVFTLIDWRSWIAAISCGLIILAATLL
jgi:4-hydroxybenzoate polyprenyltransferase